MRTVELLLDDRLESRVREVWDELDAAGLPSLARHRHASNRPHLTLATAPALPDMSFEALPVPATLDGLVRFEGRAGILAWRVRADEALRDLHRQVWAAVAGTNPLHAPDRWTPHVSLARHAPPEALDVLAGLPAATGWFVSARSYDDQTRTVTSLMS